MANIEFSSIEHVYNANLDILYSYGVSIGFTEHIVMDAIHDVFFKLCTQYSSLSEIDNLKSYLFRSLRNRLIDIKRTNREFAELSDREVDDLPFQIRVTIEDDLIKKEDAREIKQQIEAFLSLLTPRQREVIYLRYMMEYSYEEVAEIMQISVLATRNLVSRSLAKLKDKTLIFYLLISLAI